MPASVVFRKCQIAIVAFFLVPLAACAGPNVSEPPSAADFSGPAPSTSSTAAAQVVGPLASIQIRGTKFILLDASGHELADVTYASDLNAAVTTLASAIGSEPEVTQIPRSSCNTEFVKYDWDGLALNSHGAQPFRPDEAFVIEFTKPEIGKGVLLASEVGSRVGDPVAALLALPDATTEAISGLVRFEYDLTPMPVEGLPDQKSGVSVAAGSDSKITSLRAPVLTPDYC